MYIIICLLTKNAKIYIIEKKKIGKKKKSMLRNSNYCFGQKQELPGQSIQFFLFLGQFRATIENFGQKWMPAFALFCPKF